MMIAIRLKGRVDEQRRLISDAPASLPVGPVEVTLLLPTPPAEGEDEMAWTEAVAREWADEWNDPREDIYTIEDGEPVDDAR